MEIGNTIYTLDDALKKFNVFGRYHMKAAVLLILANLISALSCMSYIFIAEPIGYRCKEERFENNSCASPINTTDLCTEWVYDNPHSFVAEFNLACQEWKRALVGTVDGFGYMTGLVVNGFLSDRFGRKTLLTMIGLNITIIGQIKSFVTSYWIFIVLQFMTAMMDLYTSAFILAMEMVVHDKRVLFVTITILGYSTGYVTLALAAWLFPNWRHLVRVVYGPTILVFFYLFILDESPRWLLTKGKRNDFTKVLNKAARMNKIELNASLLASIQHQDDKSTNSLSIWKQIVKTFSSKKLSLRIFVCTTWWIASTFINYGLRINSILLPGNKYLNFAFFTPTDMIAKNFLAFILVRFRRKLLLIGSFTFAAVLAFLMPLVPENMPWLTITLYMIGVLTGVTFFTTTYVYSLEIFPTNTRSFTQGFCSSVGRIGSCMAPYSQLLIIYWKGLPALAFGAVALTAGAITFLAPNTANHELPDTVEEAEELDMILATTKNTSLLMTPSNDNPSDVDNKNDLLTTPLMNSAVTNLHSSSCNSR